MKNLLLVGFIFLLFVPYSYSMHDLHQQSKFGQPFIIDDRTETGMEEERERQNFEIEIAKKEEVINKEYEKLQQLLSNHVMNQTSVLSYFQENMDQISFNDKFKVANIVLDKYSLAELEELKEMVLNGLDDQEQHRILQDVYRRFSLEEIETLIGIGEKYVNSFLAYP